MIKSARDVIDALRQDFREQFDDLCPDGTEIIAALESAGYCIVETTWLRQMIDNSTLVSKPARPAPETPPDTGHPKREEERPWMTRPSNYRPKPATSTSPLPGATICRWPR